MLKSFFFSILLSHGLCCDAFVSVSWGSSRVVSSRLNSVTPLSSTTKTACGLSEVQYLTASALDCRGEEEGLAALKRLGEKCRERRSYDFDSPLRCGPDPSTVISRIPQLLSPSTTERLFDKVEEMVQRSWLSTNPDSVDGLPSFHINLVSNGKPLVPSDADSTDLDGFQNSIRDLLSIVEPQIYGCLLPQVNKLLKTTNIRVSDIFLRRYGEDLTSDGKSRHGISSHYDVFSRVTSVIALDDTASTGRNGLYTTAQSTSSPQASLGTASNHAALRRFFKLNRGDAVVHTFDVHHGVDVEPGFDRASLIVWFSTEEELESTNDCPSISPWLCDRADLTTNDVAQFVLASAIESSTAHDGDKDDELVLDSSSQDAMYLSSSPKVQASQPQRHRHPHDLYLDSASRGNAFALTRLGSLCENNELSLDRKARAEKILQVLRRELSTVNLPATSSSTGLNLSSSSIDLAKRFWYEAAVRGNSLAQLALADEIMFESHGNDNDSGCDATAAADARLFAATLFVLAAQQGNDEAFKSLSKLVQLEVSASRIENEQDFENSPVVQTAVTLES